MNGNNNTPKMFDIPVFTFVAGEVTESILDFEIMENIMGVVL